VTPVRNVFQKLSCTEQRREGVAAYLWYILYFDFGKGEGGGGGEPERRLEGQ
jgi:hypothetical protein